MPRSIPGHLPFNQMEQRKFLSHLTDLIRALEVNSNLHYRIIYNIFLDLEGRKYNYKLNPDFFALVTEKLQRILALGFHSLNIPKKVEVMCILSKMQWPLDKMPYMPQEFLVDFFSRNMQSWKKTPFQMINIEYIMLNGAINDISAHDLSETIYHLIHSLMRKMVSENDFSYFMRLLECFNQAISTQSPSGSALNAKTLDIIITFLQKNGNPSNFVTVLMHLMDIGVKLPDFADKQNIIIRLMFKYANDIRDTENCFTTSELIKALFCLDHMGYKTDRDDALFGENDQLHAMISNLDLNELAEDDWIAFFSSSLLCKIALENHSSKLSMQVISLLNFKILNFNPLHVAIIVGTAARYGFRITELRREQQKQLLLFAQHNCFLQGATDINFFVWMAPALLHFGVSQEHILAEISRNKILRCITTLCKLPTDLNTLSCLNDLLSTCELLGFNLRKYKEILPLIYTHVVNFNPSYQTSRIINVFAVPLLIALSKLDVIDKQVVTILMGIANNNLTLDEAMHVYRIKYKAEHKAPSFMINSVNRLNQWDESTLKKLNGVVDKLRQHIIILVGNELKRSIPGIEITLTSSRDMYLPEYNIIVCIERGQMNIQEALQNEQIVLAPRFNTTDIEANVFSITRIILNSILVENKPNEHTEEQEPSQPEITFELKRRHSYPDLYRLNKESYREWPELKVLHKSRSMVDLNVKRPNPNNM